MGAPFRVGVLEPGFATRFSNHVGIAEDLLEQIERIPERLAQLERGDGVTQQVVDMLAKRWAEGWQGIWEQLGQARDLAAAQGRDLGAYDRARADVGDLYLGVAEAKATQFNRSVLVNWRNVSTRPAHDAIAALRAAIPEIVVQKQAPIDVDLAPTSNKLLLVITAIVALAALAWLLHRALAG